MALVPPDGQADPNDLMYIKETISLTSTSTGEWFGSEMLNVSDDGVLDVWDGHPVTLRIGSEQFTKMLAALREGDCRLMVKTEVSTFVHASPKMDG